VTTFRGQPRDTLEERRTIMLSRSVMSSLSIVPRRSRDGGPKSNWDHRLELFPFTGHTSLKARVDTRIG
jgi:hypothetical protein